MRTRSSLLAIISVIVITLTSCASPQVAQQPQASKTPAETGNAGEASSTPSAGTANNSGSSSGSSSTANPQVAQAVSNYVENYYNNQNVTVDNSQTNIANQTNNTAIAEVHYTEAGKPMVAHLQLDKDANGNLKVGKLIDTNPQPDPKTNNNSSQPPNPPPAPSKPCTGQSGNVLYQADWSKGMDGWLGSQDWQNTNSMLVSKGSYTAPREPIFAPCQPSTQDYAIEAEIQLIAPQECGSRAEFGLIARATANGGIVGGFTCSTSSQAAIASAQNGNYNFDAALIDSAPFTPGKGWHRYRLEVKSNNIKFLVDGTLMFNDTDNRQLSGSKVGLFDINTQTNVRSFKIEKL